MLTTMLQIIEKPTTALPHQSYERYSPSQRPHTAATTRVTLKAKCCAFQGVRYFGCRRPQLFGRAPSRLIAKATRAYPITEARYTPSTAVSAVSITTKEPERHNCRASTATGFAPRAT